LTWFVDLDIRSVRMHLQRERPSRLLLAIYLASVALVFSFILFEVLDVDGSDFSPPSASVEARPAEAHHDDLKRAILAVALAYAAVTLPVVHRALAQALRAERRTRPPAVSFTPSLVTHVLLPRAGLSDGSAA